MYLCYVDESGDPGLAGGGSRHLLLGAAVLFVGKWSSTQVELHQLLARYFPTGNCPPEIHCADLRGGKRLYRSLTAEQRTAMLGDFIAIATSMLESELRYFTVVYDKAWWSARNPQLDGSALYIEAFEDLVSRVDLFLRRRYAYGAPAKAIVIADPHSPALSRALKKALVGFQQEGTRWSQLNNIVEAVMFLSSAESPGLQLADLCSFALWRLAEHHDPRLARAVASCFDREPINSSINPGKWHGIKYFGDDPIVKGLIADVWP